MSLKDDTLFQYLVDSDYAPSHEDGLLWNDPEIGIDWQFEKYGIDNPLLSEKDKVRKPYHIEETNFYTNKRYLITGVKGQLGYDVIRELNKRGIYDILAVDVDDMDITNKRIVDKVINEYKPEVVFHCAAWTNVDGAEDNKEACYNVNVTGTKNITDACRNVGAKLIYISTDYVFGGDKEGLYEVTDPVNPKSVYGETKVESENIVRNYEKSFIVRTSWVFGINGKNFIRTMLRLAETNKEVNVVGDQFGSPTYTVDLAKLLVDMSETEKYGTYHANNSGYCSWAEFAKYIFESNKKETKVNAIPTSAYPTKASRPLNSKLSKKSLVENGFEELPSWENAVDRNNEELNEEIKVLRKENK